MTLTNSATQAWVKEEKQVLEKQCLADGERIEINQKKQPGFFHPRSTKNNVALVPHLNSFCSRNQADTGPSNHWMTPDDAYTKGGFRE